MKTNSLTREWMLAASLIAASACGSVLPNGDDADEGPGSGSDEDIEASCESGSDCTGGTACDLNAHVCVADVLSLEDSELVYDGLRWWSTSSGPKLTGSVQAGADAVVQVKVGAAAPIAASVGSGRWNVQLPTGSIQSTDTLVSVTLTDPARGVVALEQTFALDSTPPILAAGASTVRDERDDRIDFATGAPVHDHQGVEVDLTTGCPQVHKYSYLMDTHAPTHGSELTPNPIAWALTVQDTKVAAVEFRIRQGSAVIGDWKPIIGTGASYPLVLHRDGAAGIGNLAVTAGQYDIDVRARDWGGLESSTSYCIDFRPLAAPLKFEQPTIPTDADALVGWKLSNNSPISRVTNANTAGAAVAQQKLTQYSSEPVVVSLATSAPSGTYRADYRQGWTASSRNGRVIIPCSSTPCDATLQAPTMWTWSGALTSLTTFLEIIDANGTAVTKSGASWIIPGRAAGAPPAEYFMRARINNVTHYNNDPVVFPYGERLYGTINYTGTPSSNTTSACSRTDQSGSNCIEMTTYQYIRGINTIGLTLNPYTIQVGVAASSSTPFGAPSHVPAAMFVTPALAWDGGDEDAF